MAAKEGLTAVSAGSQLSRSSKRPAPSASTLAEDAEALLLLKPPATDDAARLYTVAAGMCATGAELIQLNAAHGALAAASASKDDSFPTADKVAQAQIRRERDISARENKKVVPDLVSDFPLFSLLFTPPSLQFCSFQLNFSGPLDYQDAAGLKAALVSKIDKLCIKYEKLCIKNEKLCIKNEEFCI